MAGGGSAQGPVLKLDSGVIFLVVSQKENKVIQRREVVIRIEHRGKGTPSRPEVIDAVSKLLGVSPDLVVVRRIETEYGRDSSRAWIHVYSDRAVLEKFEPRHLIERSSKKEGGGQ
ncbi:MAG TPA: hypothetical protein VNL13_09095 [Sulfolobales archaeon]|nr:hypothetical protein [Sulfolobales archaeon]